MPRASHDLRLIVLTADLGAASSGRVKHNRPAGHFTVDGCSRSRSYGQKATAYGNQARPPPNQKTVAVIREKKFEELNPSWRGVMIGARGEICLGEICGGTDEGVPCANSLLKSATK